MPSFIKYPQLSGLKSNLLVDVFFFPCPKYTLTLDSNLGVLLISLFFISLAFIVHELLEDNVYDPIWYSLYFHPVWFETSVPSFLMDLLSHGKPLDEFAKFVNTYNTTSNDTESSWCHTW